MSTGRKTAPAAGRRATLPTSRGSLVAGLLALTLAIGALALISGGHSGASPAAHRHTGGTSPARSPAATVRSPVVGVRASDVGEGGAVSEVRDPEEARSFPVSASGQHRAATTPSVVGEEIVAAGAPSDAQVRKELGLEEHAQAQERKALHQILTPTPGGSSVGGNGTIPIPSGVPEAVQRVVAGGNAIADFPYIWGGGHASFVANGYDCSGSVSYALAAGGFLDGPLVSGQLASWGDPGPGRWITIYANSGHTFMDVNGIWFDTAGRSGPYASRWLVETPPLAGYSVRHPPGY